MWNEASVEMCRRNGWGPGTLLSGDEGQSTSIIELRYVGENSIVAAAVIEDGEVIDEPDEHNWTLEHREWRRVTWAEAAATLDHQSSVKAEPPGPDSPT